MDYAFTRAKRLVAKEEYERLFKKPEETKKIGVGEFFVLTALNSQGFARLGFALSKKMLPKASSRNRIKRVFREDFRINFSMLKNVDIIVLARRELANVSNSEIRCYLSILWQKIDKCYANSFVLR